MLLKQVIQECLSGEYCLPYHSKSKKLLRKNSPGDYDKKVIYR